MPTETKHTPTDSAPFGYTYDRECRECGERDESNYKIPASYEGGPAFWTCSTCLRYSAESNREPVPGDDFDDEIEDPRD